ncbi:MAG: O-antigen ligase family protein [Deltaproteobacteria bacterium]|nr:O-antigen ligase family protein [Deltaproteobacteria bacterium]
MTEHTVPFRRRPSPGLSTRLALWAVVAGILGCVLASLPSPLFDLDRHAVPKELVLHLTATAAGTLCLLTGRKLQVSRIDLFLAGWLLLGALSCLFAPNPWLAARALAIAFSGAVLFWVSRRLAAAGLGPPLVAAAGAGVVLAAATALAQAYGLEVPFAADARAPGGTFGNRNFMAHLVAIGLPALALSALRAQSRRRCVLAACGVGLVAAALLLSRTRAAWLAVGLAGGVGVAAFAVSKVLRLTPRIGRRALGLLIAGGLGVALAAALPNELDWRSRNPYLETARDVVNYREGSGRGRLIQYRNTLGMALDRPILGVGPGNWAVVYPLYASRGDPSLSRRGLMPANPWPSSDWVGFLVEWGPPAFGALLLVAVSLGAGGWRALRGVAGPTTPLDGLALLATLTATGVVGAFDAVLHLATPTAAAWIVAGALLPAPPPVLTIDFTRPRRWAAVAVVLLLCGGALVRSGSQAAAILVAGAGWRIPDLEQAAALDPANYRIRLLLAQTWLRRGRCDRARPHAQAAAELFPYLSEPRRLAAACGVPSPQ